VNQIVAREPVLALSAVHGPVRASLEILYPWDQILASLTPIHFPATRVDLEFMRRKRGLSGGSRTECVKSEKKAGRKETAENGTRVHRPRIGRQISALRP